MRQLYVSIILLLVLTAQMAKGTIRLDLLDLDLSNGTQIGPTSDYVQRWSTYDAPTYVTAVKPSTDADVAKIVTILA